MFGPSSKRTPWLRTTEARMEIAAEGRLPQDVVDGGAADEPAPEYIAEAAKPSEADWEREIAHYREKNRQPDQ